MNFRFSDFLRESANDKGTFKCLFITSSPLAGKSYTLDRIKGGNFPVRIVNTDNAVEGLAKLYGKDPNNSYREFGGKKIKKMTKETLYHTLNGVLPMVVDGTSADQMNLLKRKGIVEGLGYDTAMVFIDIPLEVVLKRNDEVRRGMNPNRTRAVDDDFIVDAWNKTKNLKPFYQSQFKEFQTISSKDGFVTDRDLLKAYNRTQKFFGSDNNTVAQMNIEKMREAGEAYLVPSVLTDSQLKKQTDGWYNN